MPTDDQKSDLLARWHATLPRQQELGENLITRYSEPHRRYHTTKHLLHVLTMIDRLADDHDIFLVRLAAWFHDAVYAIPAGQVSNEEASARLALRELSRVGLEQEDLNQVARLVRLTETHVPGPRDPEANCCATRILPSGIDPSLCRLRGRRTREYAQLPEESFWWDGWPC
jgi:predicted metal-dependent HD superfamily phosphohydrolase